MLKKMGNDSSSFANTSEGHKCLEGILARLKGAANFLTNITKKPTLSTEFDLRSSGISPSKDTVTIPKTPGNSMSNTMRNQLG